MADFDFPGLGRARMRLTELSRSPTKRNGSLNLIKEELIKELYVEIRAARMAGHAWKSIHKAIVSEVKLRISVDYINRAFAALDRQYETETGVRALHDNRHGGKRKGSSRKNKVQEESA